MFFCLQNCQDETAGDHCELYTGGSSGTSATSGSTTDEILNDQSTDEPHLEITTCPVRIFDRF